MPELEPITREETLLDGGDLTPITRKEMFIKRIYDKNQSVPEPITREEYFLNKAGEGSGGDVTIEQLNVTQNGTYSESGKAYSPVVVEVPVPTLTTLEVDENGTYTAPSGTAYNEVEVDVPLPENAYLLNSLSGLPADIASFNDGTDLPMASLKVAVTPYQDLSHGDPSPENICPISGWDEAVVTVADDAESPTTSHEYTIDLDGTRYGGVVDVVNGVLTVDRAMVTLDENGSYSINTHTDRNRIACDMYENVGKTSAMFVSDSLKSMPPSPGGYGRSNWEIWGSDAAPRMWISVPSTIATVADFKNYLSTNPITVVYELATPITVQLAPTAVKSLEGENKIYANCGQITEGKYFKRA